MFAVIVLCDLHLSTGSVSDGGQWTLMSFNKVLVFE